MARSNHRVILRRERAIRTAILSAKAGDLLVLAGKGHEAYEDGPRGKLPFSEREIARRALEERKRGILSEEDV
jgi:UDP-N-acetylmuramoyl-L-alanyl-D-glutamate--2,6-diaminopimelate ligase